MRELTFWEKAKLEYGFALVAAATAKTGLFHSRDAAHGAAKAYAVFHAGCRESLARSVDAAVAHIRKNAPPDARGFSLAFGACDRYSTPQALAGGFEHIRGWRNQPVVVATDDSPAARFKDPMLVLELLVGFDTSAPPPTPLPSRPAPPIVKHNVRDDLSRKYPQLRAAVDVMSKRVPGSAFTDAQKAALSGILDVAVAESGDRTSVDFIESLAMAMFRNEGEGLNLDTTELKFQELNDCLNSFMHTHAEATEGMTKELDEMKQIQESMTGDVFLDAVKELDLKKRHNELKVFLGTYDFINNAILSCKRLYGGYRTYMDENFRKIDVALVYMEQLKRIDPGIEAIQRQVVDRISIYTNRDAEISRRIDEYSALVTRLTTARSFLDSMPLDVSNAAKNRLLTILFNFAFVLFTHFKFGGRDAAATRFLGYYPYFVESSTDSELFGGLLHKEFESWIPTYDKMIEHYQAKQKSAGITEFSNLNIRDESIYIEAPDGSRLFVTGIITNRPETAPPVLLSEPGQPAPGTPAQTTPVSSTTGTASTGAVGSPSPGPGGFEASPSTSLPQSPQTPVPTEPEALTPPPSRSPRPKTLSRLITPFAGEEGLLTGTRSPTESRPAESAEMARRRLAEKNREVMYDVVRRLADAIGAESRFLESFRDGFERAFSKGIAAKTAFTNSVREHTLVLEDIAVAIHGAYATAALHEIDRLEFPFRGLFESYMGVLFTMMLSWQAKHKLPGEKGETSFYSAGKGLTAESIDNLRESLRRSAKMMVLLFVRMYHSRMGRIVESFDDIVAHPNLYEDRNLFYNIPPNDLNAAFGGFIDKVNTYYDTHHGMPVVEGRKISIQRLGEVPFDIENSGLSPSDNAIIKENVKKFIGLMRNHPDGYTIESFKAMIGACIRIFNANSEGLGTEELVLFTNALVLKCANEIFYKYLTLDKDNLYKRVQSNYSATKQISEDVDVRKIESALDSVKNRSKNLTKITERMQFHLKLAAVAKYQALREFKGESAMAAAVTIDAMDQCLGMAYSDIPSTFLWIREVRSAAAVILLISTCNSLRSLIRTARDLMASTRIKLVQQSPPSGSVMGLNRPESPFFMRGRPLTTPLLSTAWSSAEAPPSPYAGPLPR